MDYRSAGVDIEKGDRVVARIKALLGEAGAVIGHFGGAVPLPLGRYRQPLVISSVDSLGTKSLVAMALAKNRTAGRDMVHHSINDIACCGAEPIGFLDYIAMGSLDEEVVAAIIEGIVDSCSRWKVPLIGGETAEMPDIYLPGVYDLVGAIHGVVERDEYIDGRGISAGDWVIGFASAGLHTNGYSLARKVFGGAGMSYEVALPELGCSVGEALLTEHRCYLGEMRELRSRFRVKGLAHITGGGLEGNVARIIPKGLKAQFTWGSWAEPPIFSVIRRLGSVPEEDMRHTFNLGIGLAAVLDPQQAQSALAGFPKGLESPIRIGSIVSA